MRERDKRVKPFTEMMFKRFEEEEWSMINVSKFMMSCIVEIALQQGWNSIKLNEVLDEFKPRDQENEVEEV